MKIEQIITIIGTVLILGLILKDADKFNTALGAASSATNSVLKTLEAAG